jgi:predicted ATPase/DNA-binding CsgD family transcriptional regulator
MTTVESCRAGWTTHGSRASDPPVPTGRTVPEPGLHNLPQPLTSFVGRQSEIAEAGRLLRTTRLLTLTGTGGVGKTRLGHEIAASMVDTFEDGVWLVELAAMAHPGLVPDAVASVLGVRGDPKRPTAATLIDAIRPKRLLLLLDNCEHLVDACAELADTLLGACPSLWILATSRQPLGIAGETTLRVPSLALSPGLDVPSSPVIGGSDIWSSVGGQTATPTPCTSPTMSEAAQLFAARAQAVAPAFSLIGCNAAVVEQICERLDGIPLAIELAAARVAVLSLDQIADRLGDRLRLLTSGSRTALPRYRTLRALIDWSHDLLDEGERVLFRRLAVFAGGWTLEAAEAICAGDGLAPDEILDLLSGLVTKSLVLVGGHDGEARYRFLETLREYAAERLGEVGDDTSIRERHRDWFVALGERAEPELVGPHQAAWLDCLDRDRENLRAIMRRAAAQGDPETLVRLGAALWRFWHERADTADARELIAAIAPLAHRLAPSPALARVLHGAGALAGSLTEYETCRLLFTDGLAVARQLDDRRTIATILDSLGRQLFVETRYAEARSVLSEAVAIFREIDDRDGLARALSHLGFLEYLEDRQDVACAIYREGVELARAAGDQGEVAEFLDNLGRTSQAAGDLDGAARAYEEAVATWREGGHANWLAMGLNNLGGVEALRGELGVGRAHLREALDLAWRIGNRRRQAFTLAAIATLAAVGGQAERAVRLDAAASAAIDRMGARLSQPAYAHFVPHLERACSALGPTATEVAVEAGAQTPLEQAVRETLAWLSEPDGDADPDARPVRAVSHAPDDAPISPAVSGTSGLSPRELEVAALVACGLTNRRIAEELVITEGTAASHVKHILAKLVLDSRVQIVAWAIEHGLPRHARS